MPFKSKAQKAFLFSQHPEVAEEFAEKTPEKKYKSLPEHVSKDKDGLQTISKKHRRSRNGA